MGFVTAPLGAGPGRGGLGVERKFDFGAKLNQLSIIPFES
jgi:hypothetical protein